MAQEPEIVPEEENRIREHVARTAWCILEEKPLLGSGNKYVPNEADGRVIAILKGCGAPEKDIAKQMGISLDTLKEHHQGDLDDGDPYIQGLLKRTLIASAVKAADDKGHFPALKLALANKCGIYDKQQVDNVSSDGSMSPTEDSIMVLPATPFIKTTTSADDVKSNRDKKDKT